MISLLIKPIYSRLSQFLWANSSYYVNIQGWHRSKDRSVLNISVLSLCLSVSPSWSNLHSGYIYTVLRGIWPSDKQTRSGHVLYLLTRLTGWSNNNNIKCFTYILKIHIDLIVRGNHFEDGKKFSVIKSCNLLRCLTNTKNVIVIIKHAGIYYAYIIIYNSYIVYDNHSKP